MGEEESQVRGEAALYGARQEEDCFCYWRRVGLIRRCQNRRRQTAPNGVYLLRIYERLDSPGM